MIPIECKITSVPTATAHVILYRAFGLEGFPFNEWLIVDLDFSLLGIPQCVRSDDNSTDYTEWVPNNEVRMYYTVLS